MRFGFPRPLYPQVTPCVAHCLPTNPNTREKNCPHQLKTRSQKDPGHVHSIVPRARDAVQEDGPQRHVKELAVPLSHVAGRADGADGGRAKADAASAAQVATAPAAAPAAAAAAASLTPRRAGTGGGATTVSAAVAPPPLPPPRSRRPPPPRRATS